MTISEILKQAQSLTIQERKELMKLLVDTLDVPSISDTDLEKEHWGQSLNRLFDEIEPIDMKYPEIEDPVDWVKHLRSEQQKRRLGNESSEN